MSYSRRSQRPALVVAEVGVAAALSVGLGYLKVYRMPQGGSISLDMVPILFLAFYRGARQGMLAGLVTGIIKMVSGGYVIHPMQAALEYPIAFAVLGLAPLLAFGNRSIRVITGTFFATFLRFVCHVVSGVVFFASYAPEGVPVWRYSAAYNAAFLAPEMILTMVIVWYLLTEGVYRRDVRSGGKRSRGKRR